MGNKVSVKGERDFMIKAIKKFLKTIIRKKSPSEEAMDYCISHGFKHGKNFACYSDYAIDANFPWLISIGDDVTISTDVKLLAHDASTAKAGGVHTRIGKVSVGSNCFIGANSIVLPGVAIGDNCIIGAGSVVTRSIPSNTVVAGNPAQVICSYSEWVMKHRNKREKAPIFDKYEWYEWKNATESDWGEMREKLDGGCGYL